MDKSFFNGPFAPLCELYVSQKRAAGLIYEQQANLLKMFDIFCKSFDIQNYVITEEIALAWCKKRPNEKDVTRHNRVSEMQRFSTFLVKQGYPSFLFPELPKKGVLHTPYIFSMEEMKRIFDRLDALTPTNISPIRHLAIPLLFRVLFGCGLRISEALALEKRDVDLDKGILHIRHGKNDRERLVPMIASLTELCKNYLKLAHKHTPSNTPFFYAKAHAPYSKGLSKNKKEWNTDIG